MRRSAVKALADLPIRQKLAGFVVVSTFLALGTGFSLVGLTSQRMQRAQLMQTTHLLTQVMAEATAIHLFFDDRTEAELSLAALGSFPHVIDAHLYNTGFEPIADYSRTGELVHPVSMPDVGVYLEEGMIHSFLAVNRRNERLGWLYLRGSTAELDAQIYRYLTYMVLLMAALVLAALVFAYQLQGFITEPILRLAKAARRISAGGHFSLRLEKPGGDEIGELYDGFNEMLAQIAARQQQLERSNRDLDQFAYAASHDLKAPLRAIATLSTWIEEDLDDKLDDQSRQQMGLLRSRVRRLDAMIDGILQYSRLGRGAEAGEKVDVGALVRGVVDLLAPPAGFTVEIAPGLPVIQIRRARLEQVFVNLIGNAIKHHDRPEGRIEVTWRPAGEVSGEGHEFIVADDGPGIAPEHHERIFLMFQTLESKDTKESTGLGLSLVKKLVEDEGGRIEIDSDLGQGTRFRFTWPEWREVEGTPISGIWKVITGRARRPAE